MVERDTDFMLRCLRERPHTTMELISRSIRERGVGLTPHSRAADIRARLGDQGDVQVKRVWAGTRAVYRYKLVVAGDQLDLEAAA